MWRFRNFVLKFLSFSHINVSSDVCKHRAREIYSNYVNIRKSFNFSSSLLTPLLLFVFVFVFTEIFVNLRAWILWTCICAFDYFRVAANKCIYWQNFLKLLLLNRVLLWIFIIIKLRFISLKVTCDHNR